MPVRQVSYPRVTVLPLFFSFLSFKSFRLEAQGFDVVVVGKVLRRTLYTYQIWSLLFSSLGYLLISLFSIVFTLFYVYIID